MIKELILKNRSYRRFYEEHKISENEIVELIDLARCSASARNAQPLKYIISSTETYNNQIFETLSWAGYLTDWKGPEKGERPTAYIIILKDTTISHNIFCDDGIAAQSILLGATEKGLGGCMIASVNRKAIKQLFNISEELEIQMVIALGKPKETVVLTEMKNNNDFKYWRDENNVHYVPKRTLNDLIINKF